MKRYLNTRELGYAEPIKCFDDWETDVYNFRFGEEIFTIHKADCQTADDPTCKDLSWWQCPYCVETQDSRRDLEAHV